jgi:hypothetical protein
VHPVDPGLMTGTVSKGPGPRPAGPAELALEGGVAALVGVLVAELDVQVGAPDDWADGFMIQGQAAGQRR